MTAAPKVATSEAGDSVGGWGAGGGAGGRAARWAGVGLPRGSIIAGAATVAGLAAGAAPAAVFWTVGAAAGSPFAAGDAGAVGAAAACPGLVGKVGAGCGVAPGGDGVALWSGAPGCGDALACGSTAGDVLGSKNTSVGTFGRVTMVTARPGGSSVGVCSCTSPIAVAMRSWPGTGLSATMPL